jgi:predicted RNA-binding protein with PUA-like domain
MPKKRARGSSAEVSGPSSSSTPESKHIKPTADDHREAKPSGKRAKTSSQAVDDKITTNNGRSEPASAASSGYFLLKSEPEEFSIDDLKSMKNCTSGWEGVRNGQARNILSSMKVGDQAFFYHSSDGKRTGIYGTVKIVREAYPDTTAEIPAHKYFDPKHETISKEWVAVDVELVEKWDKPILLNTLKDRYNVPGSPLHNMLLFRNSRLSVQTVAAAEWDYLMSLKNSA